MSRQTTLNVSLTATLRTYVARKVKSGRYESASEVVRDGLRALQERERAAERLWADARDNVAVARRQVSEGKMVDGEGAMDEILAELLDETPGANGARPRKRRGSAR
jgi:antitoxin ParD1/3/4